MKRWLTKSPLKSQSAMNWVELICRTTWSHVTQWSHRQRTFIVIHYNHHTTEAASGQWSQRWRSIAVINAQRLGIWLSKVYFSYVLKTHSKSLCQKYRTAYTSVHEDACYKVTKHGKRHYFRFRNTVTRHTAIINKQLPVLRNSAKVTTWLHTRNRIMWSMEYMTSKVNFC